MVREGTYGRTSSPGNERRVAFEKSIAEANFVRLQWLLLALITANGIMAFLGHELGPLGRLLPRTGQLMEFLVSPVLLGLLWVSRSYSVRQRRSFTWCVVAVESLACAWYFYVALPVFGPTAVFALTIISMGVFVLVPPGVFALIILPATLLHISLSLLSPEPLPVKLLVVLHGVAAALVSLVAQHFLFSAREANFFLDQALLDEVDALRQHKDNLELRCQTLQESTAFAAHDLKGPLQSLVAAFRLAASRKEWRTEPHASLLRESIDTCANLLDLGGRVLNDYRSTRSTQPGQKERQDLRLLIDSSATIFHAVASERSIFIKTNFPSVPCWSLVDAPTLRSALENLFDNAISFSPRNSTLEITLSQAGSTWRIAISDQGCGIPPDEQALIFQRFFQATNRPADLPPGNGLGLWMAHQRIKAQGGSLSLLKSSPVGTTFEILLPACADYHVAGCV
jgi:signal transduction histidine kinase